MKMRTKISLFSIILVLFSLLILYKNYITLKTIQKKQEQLLIELSKGNISSKTSLITSTIEHILSLKDSPEERQKMARFALKPVVDVAASLTKKIVESNEKKKEIIKDLRKYIGSIRYNGKKGYIFILDSKGNLLVHPKKSLEGKNVINIRDVKGKLKKC